MRRYKTGSGQVLHGIRPLLLVSGLMGPALGAFGIYGVFVLLVCCIPAVFGFRALRIMREQALISVLGLAILLFGLLWGIFADGTSWVAYHFAILAISGSVFVAFSFLVRGDFGVSELMTWLWRFSCLLLLVCLIEIFTGVRLPVSRYSPLAPLLGFTYDGFDGSSEIFANMWIPTGFFGNQNNLSFALICLLPFAKAASRTMTTRLLMVATIGFVIFLSESRVALLVLLLWSVTSICFFVMRSMSAWRLAVVFAFALATVPLAYRAFDDACSEANTKLCFGVELLQTVDLDVLLSLHDSIGVRVQLASQSLQLWTSSPLFGVGPGHLSELVSAVYADGLLITDPHNPPIQLLAEYGIVGTALWVIAMGVLFRSALDTPRTPVDVGRFRNAALTLFFIIPLGSIAISAVYYFIPMWVLLGAVFGGTIESNRLVREKSLIVSSLNLATGLAPRRARAIAPEGKK